MNERSDLPTTTTASAQADASAPANAKAGSLAGKTVLLTGGSAGIGPQAAVKLARLGGEIVLVARDAARLEAAVAEVKQRSGSDKVRFMVCDFSSQAAIRRLVEEFLASSPRLDVLVNNAGSVWERRTLSPDGLEMNFAVNHLGYYLLTRLLLERIQQSAPARIVVVSSIGHRRGELDLADLQMEQGYAIMRAYRRSKLGNVLFTRELARRLAADGVKNVTVNALHPGGVATNIWSHAPWWSKPILALARLGMISPEQGGDTIVHLAASPEVEGLTGGYYEKNRLVDPAPLGRDEALARRLWDVSAELTGLAP